MWLSARESAQLQYPGIKSLFEKLFLSVNTYLFVMHIELIPGKQGRYLNAWRVGEIDFKKVCLLD